MSILEPIIADRLAGWTVDECSEEMDDRGVSRLMRRSARFPPSSYQARVEPCVPPDDMHFQAATAIFGSINGCPLHTIPA